MPTHGLYHVSVTSAIFLIQNLNQLIQINLEGRENTEVALENACDVIIKKFSCNVISDDIV